MKESKDHLNIDLEFLDKKDHVRVALKQETPKGSEPNWRYYDANKAKANSGSGKKYNWKNILIIGGVVLFFGWVIFSDSNSSSTPSSSSYTPSTQNSDGTVVRGDYRCSSYYASQVDNLAPTDSESSITIAQNSLDQRSTYLDNLKSEIDNSSVNNYSSQYEIDNYNQQVDDYNAKLASYKRDATSLSSRIDTFNAQVQAHNNYLMAHCTKAY